MCVDFMKHFAGVDEINSVSICRQFCQDVYIEAQKYALKIDVLIIVNDSIAVIVEDKTYMSKHDNQIQRYVDGIRYLAAGRGFYRKSPDCTI